MDKIINLDLMKEPLNWIIVLLMAMSASMAIRYVFMSYSTSSEG